MYLNTDGNIYSVLHKKNIQYWVNFSVWRLVRREFLLDGDGLFW